MHTSQSDSQLLDLFTEGSLRAFDQIYDRHSGAVYHLAYRIIEDHDLAKDVVQEVFLSFYEHARGKQILNLKAYLLQTAKYQCFMHLRSGRISENHLQRLDRVIISNMVEDELNAADLQKVIDEGIAALPEKCREVFYLSRFEFLSNKKIAEQLNISPKTVENQITKALKTLKTSVDKLAVSLLILLS